MLKTLGSRVREYKTHSILSPLFMTCEVALECLLPFLMARLIDYGIYAGDLPMLYRLGGILLLVAVASVAVGVLSSRSAAIASAGFASNLRHDMYHHVQDFSFSNIDRFSTSSIITRLTTDVTNIQNAYMMLIRFAVRCPMMLIISLIMAFRIHPTIPFIFVGVIPVLGIGLTLIVTHAHPIFEKVFKTYDQLNNVVQENLRGIRVVKAFVREDHERAKFSGISQKIYDLFVKAEKILSFNMPLMQISIYSCMLLLSWFGARIIVLSGSTALTTGQLTSLFTYTMQILMALMMLSMVFVVLTMSRASGERIAEVLTEKSSISNCDDPITEVPDGSVSFRDVNFSYAGDMKKLCLTDVDLDIASGETVGILGGTGTSKTTLVQLIPRLYDVTSGSVCVGGIDVRRYDIHTLRNNVAMVLQKNELFSGTVKDNLRWGNEHATDEELIEACRLAQADGFVRELENGYDTYIEQGGTNVSGGQKQRLCIARALLKKPKILILDDSTSAVDTQTDAQIRKGFREYIPDTTKIIIAQRISSVQDADKIILMDNGRIVAWGTHEQLLADNVIYREIYDSQQKGVSIGE